MRIKLLFLSVLFSTISAYSQDFTNKGKDFWVGYGSHCDMYNGNGTLNAAGGGQEMVLYFATQQLTTVTVSIPTIGYSQTYSNIAANTIFETPPIPKSGTNDARLGTEGIFNKGIHITSDFPIVAYAHIYNGSRSGATLLFPTNTLGKEYYSLNMSQNSQQAYSYCYFFVVAADTGTTTIQVVPTANTQTMTAGQTYTYTLVQGQVFNALGSITGNSGVDLTGTKVTSIASASGKCKPIAVFSGSGKINLNCPVNGGGSADNYIVQSFPKTAWGKNYLTVPTYGMPYNYFRIAVSDPTAVVKLNGVTLTGLINNFYYQVGATNQPNSIQSDKPIMVAQYITTSGACGNNVGIPNGDGDPEVIYLSSIEQNISSVLLYATPHFAITEHFISVLIPNGGTGVSSFRLDGAVPANPFVVHPQNSNYSYLQQQVSVGTHTLQSDSGFNASAYGYGSVESYGYNAGTNIKDLYQQIGVQTQYGIETTPSVCTNAPFRFKVSLPYIPDSMYWNFHNAAGMMPNNTNVMVNNTGNQAEDSTTVVNGKTIHWYSLPTLYTFSTVGVYPITITTYVPNADCGTVQDIDFDLTVSDPPLADFSWSGSGCVTEPFRFTETTPQFPKPTYHFWWDFNDPASGANNNSGARNPTHLFTTPGTYNVRFSDITTPGCLSDTIVHQVVVSPLPAATISGSTTVCINSAPSPVIFTGSFGTVPYTFSYTIDAGSGPGPVQTINSTGTTATITAPTAVAGTFIYRLVSVRDTGSVLCTQNITGQQATVVVLPDATINLTSGAGSANQTVCINTPIANITYAIGGSGNNAAISAGAFPAGVTGNYSGGVYTISGTPAVSGIFPYTITTTGPCVNHSLSGTISVNANSTIMLSSAPGTDAQTVCINTPLTNITYAIAAGGTGASITAGVLPPGVTGSYSGGVFTISGTPAVTGIFNYTVTTSGPCVNPSVSGTITVQPNSTINLSSAPGSDAQVVCVNTAIANITYAVGGSGNGASITAGSFPAGVTGSYSGGLFTISGTPTTSGVFPYTVTTAGPCVNISLSGTITVEANSTISLSSATGTDAQILCAFSSLTDITYAIGGGGTGASVTAGGLPAGVTGSYSGGIFTISGIPSVSGIFPYTVTTTGPCINSSVSGSITVKPLPGANFNFSTPSCETRTISFTDVSVPNTGTINSWAWNFGDPSSGTANISNVQNPQHSFATAGIYMVSLVVTSTSSCTSTVFNRQVVINARPQAGYIIPEVCLSDTYAQFLDTSKISAGSIVAWAWNFGDPNATIPNPNTSNLQNPTHSYTAVGNYNVQLIVTSSTGCKDTITQVLTVNGSFPVANFTVNNPANLCANDSVAIVNSSTVFPGSITKVEIYWDNVNFPAVFELDDYPYPGKIYKHLYANFQAPPIKTFTIKFRAYSGGVCLNDKLGNITVHAAPKVQFNPMPDICLFAPPYQITQAAEIGGVPGTFVYSGAGVSPTGLFSPAIAGVGSHRIIYTFTSNAGACVDTAGNTINVLDTATAAFSYVAPTCENIPTSFTDQSTAPANVTLSNTVWDFGDGSPVQNHLPGSAFTHLFPGANTYNVTMYNVSAYGCRSTAHTIPVTVDPNHSIILTSAPGTDNQVICINTAITPITYMLGGGAANATVSGLPPGVSAGVAGNMLTISGIPNSTLLSPFNYSITTTGNTCVAANAAGTIKVLPDHTISLDPGSNTGQSVCVNTPIDPISYTLGGGASGVTITGLPAGVTYSLTGNTLTISGSPVVTFPFLYNYTITTTGNSCIKATTGGSIKVNPYPVVDFTFDKPAYCIPNAKVVFISTSTIEDGTENAFTYLWNFGEPSSGINNTSIALGPGHWYATAASFPVNLKVTSGAMLNNGLIGCTHDTTIFLRTIHPQPKADFKSNRPSVCITESATFTDQTDYKDGTSFEWHWDMGDGNMKTINPVIYTYHDTITYPITFYTVNSFGCNSDTITRPFTVYPYPKVDAGPDRYILEGGSIILETLTSGNDLQYLWSPDLYLNNNKIPGPTVFNSLTDMTYTLKVTARGGCQMTDQVFVKLLKTPRIPNTFTPNGDQFNPTWKIEYLDSYPNCKVQVFTRTGQLVFESTGYKKEWDGTFNGKPLPFDTYYYIIEPNNGRSPITGYVTIIK